ncbi:hypothetical protein [Oricola sp.]|uniref:hypothetical protein n=1 Tax=Oricola sp. TaxID=1979950 RepID=UPI000C8A1A01|nr:hypothetical protein [Ahrensia sp.]|tara:strand:+ start:3688 stop:3930 length:243 start_codon:yes stop_codon:yes gene_type:complete
MRKALIALAATLVATASLQAAEMKMVVESVDYEGNTIVFTNGETMTIAEGVDFTSIDTGDNVTIITDDRTGEITQIEIPE